MIAAMEGCAHSQDREGSPDCWHLAISVISSVSGLSPPAWHQSLWTRGEAKAAHLDILLLPLLLFVCFYGDITDLNGLCNLETITRKS